MFDEIEIALILAKDEVFMAAVEDLESLDYEVFTAANKTIQQRMTLAVTKHSMKCRDCAHTSPVSFCQVHIDMFNEVDKMLTSEDAPEFQGTLPTPTPTTSYAPAPAGYEELVKEMYS